MCFEIHKNHAKGIIATEPVKCFKTVRVVRTDLETRYYSIVQGFLYYADKAYKIDTTLAPIIGAWLDDGTRGLGIEEGFHSYTDSLSAFVEKHYWDWDLDHNFSVVECEIPTGAKYYYNPKTRQYVSDTLIIRRFYPTHLSILDAFAFPFTRIWNFLTK